MCSHVTDHSRHETATGNSNALERWLARQIAALVASPTLAFELWDGYRAQIGTDDRRDTAVSGHSPPDAVLVFRDRGALYRALYKPEFAFGELFASGRLIVRGDLVRVMEHIYRGQATLQLRHGNGYHEFMRRVFGRRALRNTLRGSKQNIHAHYDLGNDFYGLWLDREHQQYTCAYFPTAHATLEAAQRAKLELVARKLALRPGERVIEAGGGWGGLARYLAQHHGVRVRSFNISGEQVRYARERSREAGLEDRVEYIEDDYRNISGTCDAFVSVGMLEHVGVSQYAQLGAVIDRCLTDDGRGLIHSIGQDEARPLNEWIERRIFPGAEPPTLAQMMTIFPPLKFFVTDVENLRPHYAQTLRHWHQRFEENADRVAGMFDERFVRTWRLYLCGSLAAFSAGRMQLFQVVFTRPGSAALPPTREHLFAAPMTEPQPSAADTR